MTYVAYLALGLAVGAFGAWMIAGRRGMRTSRQELSSLVRGLQSGNLPDPARSGDTKLPEIKALREVLAREWVRAAPGSEDEARRALQRIAVYLRRRVESPLLQGLAEGGKGLERGADEALGAIEDLEFFLEEPSSAQEPVARNLTEVVQEVTREFAGQSTVLVKVRSPREPIRVRIDPEPLKDALFLLLHNAGEFGGRRPVEITLDADRGAARIRVADGGPGFTAEALVRAMDPFYSTSPDGLGLGLPHARRAVNQQGGELFLRNRETGGAEVEIRLPLGG